MRYVCSQKLSCGRKHFSYILTFFILNIQVRCLSTDSDIKVTLMGFTFDVDDDFKGLA